MKMMSVRDLVEEVKSIADVTTRQILMRVEVEFEPGAEITLDDEVYDFQYKNVLHYFKNPEDFDIDISQFPGFDQSLADELAAMFEN